MIKYFKELLATLKSIDKRLEQIEKNTRDLPKTIRTNRKGQKWLSTNASL